MNDDPGRPADVFTISDLIDWLVQLLFWPGDAALGLLIRFAPSVARFLELGREDYGGTLSILISILFWLAVVLLLGTLANFIRNLDRKLTEGIAEQYREARTKLRVAARLRASRREQKKAGKDTKT
jgi:uncharacterized protein involved in cysteine biosynthesis